MKKGSAYLYSQPPKPSQARPLAPLFTKGENHYAANVLPIVREIQAHVSRLRIADALNGRGIAVQLLLGHTRLESTVRYLGIACVARATAHHGSPRNHRAWLTAYAPSRPLPLGNAQR
jgi:hypothetical protein